MITHDQHDSVGRHQLPPISRRGFLAASGTSLLGLPSGLSPRSTHAAESANSGPPATAKSTILFFLCGGASQIDTWDLKPDAPAEIRGEFNPISTSAPGVRLCEHLPLTARLAHHLAVVNSIDATDPTNSHLGYYYQLTGHELDARTIGVVAERRQRSDDWPFIGSVVASKLPQRSELPNAISFPWIPEGPPDIRAGQFAGRLGIEHDPLYLSGSQEGGFRFNAPALVLEQGLSTQKLLDRRSLLRELDQSRSQLERFRETQTWQRHQDRAFNLLSSGSTAKAFDISREPQSVRTRYGETMNGMALLLARRLVEVGVPFITVFWKPDNVRASKLNCASAGGWDTHGNNFQCLKEMLLPEFDQCYSALIEDLVERGLLDSTLLLVSSEMGRRPKIGDVRSGGVAGAGRDHWTYCLTNLLAGGGVKGGQTYGSTDKYGEYPLERRVTPADIAHTIYHTMGIHDLSAIDSQNRPYGLLDEGRPIYDIL